MNINIIEVSAKNVFLRLLFENGRKDTQRLLYKRCRIKVKSLCLAKHHAMKAYWGSGGIAPRIL
jgi:hypothetical protein